MTTGTNPQPAAATILRQPLRWHNGDEKADPAVISARGWFRGADECARYLQGLCGGEVRGARGFGGRWPVISTPGGLIAPAVPLVITRHGGDGADASYELRGDTVWREAAGTEMPLIVLGEDGASPGETFDLLWFGDHERWVLHRGVLVIDDLFAEVELCATRTDVEKLLVRGRRVEGSVLDGLRFDASARGARVTVRRSAALTSPDTPGDPARLFLVRPDVERAHLSGDRLELATVHNEPAVFTCREDASGWCATLADGRYPFREVALRRSGGALELSVELDPGLDALAPGMRERLAFDLRSDLVSLD